MYAVLSRLFLPGAEAVSRGVANVDDDERQMILACQRGDRGAMHLLYQRHVGRVRTLVARIVGPAEADELTQEVFVKALRGIHGFRGESQIGTWLYRLAVNAALSYATREQGRQRRQLGDEMLQVLPADPGRETDPILRDRLQTALAALPAGYRAVLVLHDIEGLQHEEIAEILNVRVGTSKSQLHKARARMRELLEAPR